MKCSRCGKPGETRYGVFRSNIGLVLLRFTRVDEGFYCQQCFSSVCWKHQVTNLTVGWWGLMSFFTTLVLLPTNAFFNVFGGKAEPVGEAASPESDEAMHAVVIGRTAEARAQSFGGAVITALGAAICFVAAMLQPPPKFHEDNAARAGLYVGAAAFAVFSAALVWRGLNPRKLRVVTVEEPVPAQRPAARRTSPAARSAPARRPPPRR